MAERSTVQRRASASCLLPYGRYRQRLRDLIRQLQSEVDNIERTADGETSECQQERLYELQTILVDSMILRDEMGHKASWFEPTRKRAKMLRDRVAELRSRTDKAMEYLQGNTGRMHGDGSDMDGQDDQTLPSPELLILSRSANKAAVQIMQALEDEEMNLIGLVGFRGVGKTTLVRQIERKAKGSGLFHQVVMLRTQRKKTLEEDRGFVRRQINNQKLEEKLQQRKNVLVILEDVWWENPDLNGIGLYAREGLKILVTTCFPKVCSSLRCDTTIKLEGLTAEEAVTLFERSNKGLQLFISGRPNYSFQQWRDRIIGASEGLPYTIVTMIVVILSKSSADSDSANPTISKYLELYYDYLNEFEVKTFLIISRFPQDYAPTLEEVIRYLIGQRVLEGAETGTIENIRSRVHVLISNLQANSFLTMENGTLKIANLFRMLGHQTPERYDPCMFFLKSSELNRESRPSPINKSMQVGALSITVDTDEIPEYRVPTYFGRDLNVLNLRGSLNGSSSLPPSIQLSVLTNLPTTLQTLLLSCFTLSKDDMTCLGKLMSLKILSFNGCDIGELPDDLGELHDLRLLDLSDCLMLPTFAPNLLQRLSKLEELYISTADTEVKTEASDNILRQICSLSKLTVLSIEIQFKGLPPNMVLPKLPRYKIEISTNGEKLVSFHQNRHDLPARALRVMGEFPRNAFQDLLPDTEHLFLTGEKGLTIPNLVPHLDPGGLTALKELKLHQCKTMQCIIDMPEQEGTRSVLENLTSLELVDLPYLKRLCKGEGSLSFGNLKVINISECKELRDPLFSPSVAQGLKQLEILELNSCINLSDIAKDCDRGCFPALSTIKIGSCTKLQHVFDIRIFEGPANKVRDIEITDCDALRHVFVDGSRNNDDTFELPHLQRLVLTRLNKLDSICPGKNILVVPSLQEFKLKHFPTLKPFLLTHSKVARNTTMEEQGTSNNSTLPQLKVLELNGFASTPECPKNVISLRERSTSFSCLIVTDFQELFDDQSQYFLSNLKELKFSNAFHLTTLGTDGGLMSGTSQNLIHLELIKCPKLRHIFTLVHVKNVPKLQHLSIEECSQLEQIITDDHTSSGASTATREAEPRTCFPNLVEISIKNCHELRSVFPTRFLQFPKLKSFKVESASKLLHIFAVNYSQDQGIMSQHKYLELPKLQELSLIDLKSLITFAPMDYRIGFPSLSSLKIRGCPKMETTFVTASGACVYAERKVRSSMDESSTLMKNFGQAMIPFPIFSGGDYETWHSRMKTYFLSRDLWEIIEKGVAQKENLSEERKKDAQALSIILQASPSSVIGDTSKAKSAKDAWVLLKECFQKNGKFDVEWKSKARNVEPILYDPKDIMEELFVED